MRIILVGLLLLCGCHESPNETALPSRAPASPSENAMDLPRGIRVDPAYFYNSHPGQTAQQIAADVMANLKATGANTVYVYAYNSIYGASYPTTYPFTDVENGYGQQNIFAELTREATRHNLRVVAVVPLNNFKKLWQNQPTWRVKQAAGADYIPAAEVHLLSASVSAFRDWHRGFIDDLITRHPDIYGVEVVEPTLDYHWSGAPDQNAEALAEFQQRHPGASIGSAAWLNFRADEFLNLISSFNQSVHAHGKQTYLIQTWTAQSDGSLMSNTSLRNGSGFDFVGVSRLEGTSKTDNLMVELIWQQWFSEYGNAVFSPEWISTAASELSQTLQSAGAVSRLILHLEISQFSGAHNLTVPASDEFGRNLDAGKQSGFGLSIYDYEQLRTRGVLSQVKL